MLASLFIKHYDLNKKLETEHTLHESRAANLLIVTMEKAGSSRAISEKGQSEGPSNAPSFVVTDSCPTPPLSLN